MQERLYWLGFSFFHGIGPVRFRLLRQTFWTAENAWNASEVELKHCGIGEKVTEKFLDFRRRFSLEEYAQKLEKGNIHYLLSTDKEYPQLLGKIENPPFVLYVKGNIDLLHQTEDRKYIAVVGTRKVTEYGRQVTESLTQDLASAGCIIVSGLALGVDAIAHASTLAVKGKTIAVLGCGVDCCTPRENERLYQQIIDQDGAIVSEAPLSQLSFKGSFPARNRIIAGLSLGVLVTEGAEDSGSLITANDALKNDRLVFAVPGPITSSVSRGPISLITNGSKMVTSGKDILEEIGIATVHTSAQAIVGDTVEEQQIIDILFNESLGYDEISKKSGLPSSQLSVILSLMEMKGFIRTNAAGRFVLHR